MDTSTYQQLAEVTEAKDFESIAKRLSTIPMIRFVHASWGLMTELGEWVDQLKRHVFYNKPLDVVNLSEEQGDMFWYHALAANADGVPLIIKMEKNIAKLRARYGSKFDEFLATHRDLVVEREILEGNQAYAASDGILDGMALSQRAAETPKKELVVPKAFFFGCGDGVGHYMFKQGMKKDSEAHDFRRTNPWGYEIDNELAPKDGTLAISQRNGWTVIACTDYSVDSRPGSNAAAFLAEGDFTREEMKELVERIFPEKAQIFRSRRWT